MLKISLSGGHGIDTPGKRTPDGMKEWEFNGAVVKEMQSLLALYKDVAVLRLDHPFGKVDYPLQERSDRSTAWGADVHIDIHANAAGEGWGMANGIETFVYSLEDKESFDLANTVQQKLINETHLKNRGVKQGNLHMVREPRAKAKILVEAGFMTNKEEAALLKSHAYRRLVAKCIVDALVNVYRLEKRGLPVNNLSSFPKAQEWVKAMGVSDGNDPKGTVSREQVWEMLRRYHENHKRGDKS